MSEQDFEHQIQNKLNGVDVEPAGSNWDAIGKMLDQQKGKRGMGWWIFTPLGKASTYGAIALALVIGGFAYFNHQDSLKNQNVGINTKPTISTPDQNTYTPSVVPHNARSDKREEAAPVSSETPSIDEHKQPYSSSRPHGVSSTPLTSRVVSSGLEGIKDLFRNSDGSELTTNEVNPNRYDYVDPAIKQYSLLDASKFNLDEIPPTPVPMPPSKKNNSSPHFVVGASINALGTYRILKATTSANAEQKAQIAFRNKIEASNLDYSTGLFLKYQVTPWFQIGSGLNITHYSERIMFRHYSLGFSSPRPAINMDAQYEQQNKNNPDVFQLPAEYIYSADSNSSDAISGLVNSYYFTEIPLTFTFIKYGKRWNVYAEPSVSYARLNLINASIVELDRTGFTGVKDMTNYQGVQHLFNANLTLGLGYNITPTFSISATANYKQSLNPLIDLGYAKQYPYAIGGGLAFARRF